MPHPRQLRLSGHERPVNSNEQEAQMRKIGLSAVAAAFILAGIGVWVASTTHARVEAAIEDHLTPFQLMLNAKDLPIEKWDAF